MKLSKSILKKKIFDIKYLLDKKRFIYGPFPFISGSVNDGSLTILVAKQALTGPIFNNNTNSIKLEISKSG